jgi:CelD/BcsL family acetyltransferase involved in cellulose biosynthesis
MTMHVTRLATLSELACIRRLWNQLARGMPLRSWEWLESWWRYYGAESDPRRRTRELFTLAVFTSDGELIGLAPWYLQRVAGQGRVIRFLGTGEVCTDYSTILCQPGLEREVARTIVDWLVQAPGLSDWLTSNEQRPWDVLEFNGIGEQDQVLKLLCDYLVEADHLLYERPGPSCWRLPLPATWDEYLSTLSKSHRKQIRRCERKVLSTDRALLHTATDEAQRDKALDVLTKLHNERRQKVGGRGAFASARFLDFHDEVTMRMLAQGKLGLHWIELDGRPVAAEYHLSDQDGVYAYQSGIAPTALDEEPGRLITIATIQRAIADGKKWFDFLRGDEPYKAHWRAEPLRTRDIRILPRTHSARVRHTLWIASDNVKNWLKSGFGIGNR